MNVKMPKGSDAQIIYPEQLDDIMQSVLPRENRIHKNQKYFWFVGTGNASKHLFMELVGLGQPNRIHADSPTIFRVAIYKMAVTLTTQVEL